MDSTKHSMVKQIDQWEKESIDKIKRQAQLCRTQWVNYSNAFLRQIENKLDHFAQQMREIHQENEFNELDLNELKQRLDELEKQLNQPTNVSIEQQSTSFINNISLLLESKKGRNPSKLFS